MEQIADKLWFKAHQPESPTWDTQGSCGRLLLPSGGPPTQNRRTCTDRKAQRSQFWGPEWRGSMGKEGVTLRCSHPAKALSSAPWSWISPLQMQGFVLNFYLFLFIGSFPRKVRAVPGRSWEVRIQSRPPVWTSGTQLLMPVPPAASQVYISRKLEPRLESKHSN